MERVVTVNLNGHPYTMDESAYAPLRDYLDRARAALSADPDREEILRDLEQAIADKCRAHLGAHKSVIAHAEVMRALDEMGPVHAEGAEPAQDAPHPDGAGQTQEGAPPKRLFRVRDGAVFSGVCSGLGAYFDLDANIIRLVFIAATLFSGGAAALLYLALMFIVPSANTREEWAQAHGLAFNAQEVIERAKQDYARFSADPPWGGRMRRKWRRRYREWRRAHAWGGAAEAAAATRTPVSYGVRVGAGAVAIVFTILGAALTIAFLLALVSLLTAGAVLSWSLPASVPVWFAVLSLFLVFAVISAPISAVRHWSYATMHGVPGGLHGWGDHRHGGLSFALGVVLALAITHALWPDARATIEQIPQMAQDFWTSVVAALGR